MKPADLNFSFSNLGNFLFKLDFNLFEGTISLVLIEIEDHRLTMKKDLRN